MDHLTQNIASIDGDELPPFDHQPTFNEPAELTALVRGFAFVAKDESDALRWVCSEAIQRCEGARTLGFTYLQIRTVFPFMSVNARQALASEALSKLRAVTRHAEREQSIMIKPQPKGGEVYGKISI
jgi:hypothetical protein